MQGSSGGEVREATRGLSAGNNLILGFLLLSGFFTDLLIRLRIDVSILKITHRFEFRDNQRIFKSKAI